MKIKRVAAVHDICGYGKCSLTIAIPVLSSFGIEVCPVPTGVFSMHTALDNWNHLDTTNILDDYIRSWNKEGFQLDAIYSGFLSNKDQANIIEQLYVNNPKALKFVDPVMGDWGKLYKTYNEELVNATKSLVKKADIITPNLTEAQFLTGKNDILDCIESLHGMGAKNVVLTGIIENNTITNYVSTNKITKISCEYNNKQVHGTGDLFSSVVLGKILTNSTLEHSVEYATEFLKQAIDLTVTQIGYESRGVSFEPLLGSNTAAIPETIAANTVGKISQP